MCQANVLINGLLNEQNEINLSLVAVENINSQGNKIILQDAVNQTNSIFHVAYQLSTQLIYNGSIDLQRATCGVTYRHKNSTWLHGSHSLRLIKHCCHARKTELTSLSVLVDKIKWR